jgi:hypothetical protein
MTKEVAVPRLGSSDDSEEVGKKGIRLFPQPVAALHEFLQQANIHCATANIFADPSTAEKYNTDSAIDK